MTTRLRIVVATAVLCAASAAAGAAPPQPIERFARRPQIHGVTLSTDGRYVAFLSGAEDDTVLMTFDRTTGGAFKRVTASEPNKFDIGWCRWANEQRLLCSVYGNFRGKKYAEPPFQRLFAVNADGAALKALEGPKNDANLLVTTTSMRNLNMNQGAHVDKSTATSWTLASQADSAGANVAKNYVAAFKPERQDEVLDLTPDDRDTVLIQVDEDRDSYPALFQLNINTGARSQRALESPPIQSFVTDGRGNARIGQGTSKSLETSYYARLDGDREWRRLTTTPGTGASALRPIAMTPGVNSAYAIGDHEGRDALWSIDLTDQRPPQLLFHHPLVDVGEPILQTDRRLIGVRYDVERPYAWYADPKLRELIDKLEKQFPGRVQEIVDMSEDRKTLVIKSSSDTDEGTYSLYNTDENKLKRIGTAYPELDEYSLGRMTNILYKASDGTEVPGYLTVPSGADPKNLPLIVMPHDGPLARDTFKFSFLRAFLANRGYAVLQMNYRGSSGFGEKWRLDANPNWAALAYSDIQDATEWAISEGIADPKRICIMGWGFGGYEALLSVSHNVDTYRCAVSIGGIADLDMQRELAASTGYTEGRKELGNDRKKQEHTSPLDNAAKINAPVLLIHGTKDWQVQVDHTTAMTNELAGAKKPHKTVLIKGGSHELERKSDRMTLLKEVEDFLTQNLGAAATAQ